MIGTFRATTPLVQAADTGDLCSVGGFAATDVTAVEATVTYTVVSPSGASSTGTATAGTATGLYYHQFTATWAGRWTCILTAAGDAVGVVTGSFDVEDATGTAPNIVDLADYLGNTVTLTDDQLAAVLATEKTAQMRRCDVPSGWPADIVEALYRRCARNIAARNVPVAQYTSFDGGGTAARVTRTDPEIERLEWPFRKRVIR